MTALPRQTHEPAHHRGADGGALNADDIPVVDAAGRLDAGNVEDALAELSAEIASRVSPLEPAALPDAAVLAWDALLGQYVGGDRPLSREPLEIDVAYNGDGTVASVTAARSGATIATTIVAYVAGKVSSITTTRGGRTVVVVPTYTGADITHLARSAQVPIPAIVAPALRGDGTEIAIERRLSWIPDEEVRPLP